MNYQKGFSLIEVLVSLMLMTTMALALLDQQLHTRQLIRQSVLQAEASHLLFQVKETSRFNKATSYGLKSTLTGVS